MKNENQTRSKTHNFFSFLALLLLLLGIYASIRTMVNLTMFKKYPTTGILSFNMLGLIPPFSQREEDCLYSQQYFDSAGQPRPPTKEEKQYQKDQQRICISGVVEARRTAKINDINTSFLFLFLGGGLLLTKKFFT